LYPSILGVPGRAGRLPLPARDDGPALMRATPAAHPEGARRGRGPVGPQPVLASAQGRTSTSSPVSTSWNVTVIADRSTRANVREVVTTGAETTEPGLTTSPRPARQAIGSWVWPTTRTSALIASSQPARTSGGWSLRVTNSMSLRGDPWTT